MCGQGDHQLFDSETRMDVKNMLNSFKKNSLWLAVSMALIRYLVLRKPQLQSKWTVPSRAWKMSAIIALTVLGLSMPNLFLHQIVEVPYDATNCTHPNDTPCTIDMAEFAKENGCQIFKLNLWMTGVVFKFIPTVLLMMLSLALMYRMRVNNPSTRTDKDRQNFSGNFGKIAKTRNRTADRTTVILIGILLIFFITESPQGVLAIASAIYIKDVYFLVYNGIGDVLDLLSLINSSANFLLYTLMSSTYRSVFRQILFPQKISRHSFNRTTRYDHNRIVEETVDSIESPTGKKLRPVKSDSNLLLKRFKN